MNELEEDERADIENERDAALAEVEKLHQRALHKCGCEFSDDGETLTQICGYHQETVTERDAALARVAALEEALHQCVGSLKALGAENGYASEAARAALAAPAQGDADGTT